MVVLEGKSAVLPCQVAFFYIYQVKINFCYWFWEKWIHISLSSKNINIGGRRSRSCLPIYQTAWPSFAKVTNFHQITISIFHFSNQLAQQSDQVLPDYNNTNFSCLKISFQLCSMKNFHFSMSKKLHHNDRIIPQSTECSIYFSRSLECKKLCTLS